MEIAPPPPIRTIIPPPTGWKPKTFYAVRVAWNKHNVIHKAIFYSGFLNDPDNQPGGYNRIWNPTYDGMGGIGSPSPELEFVHYLEVIGELPYLGETDAPTDKAQLV
jgi:hypothetical protein